MQTKFKLKDTLLSNHPVLDLERAADPQPFIWIGNDMPNDMRCYATLSGKATLRRLALNILESLDRPKSKRKGRKRTAPREAGETK